MFVTICSFSQIKAFCRILRETCELIAQALEALPDTLRVPLIMRDLDQLAYQDIADQLGVSLSAVKMRIKRGREQIRTLYEAAA